MMKKSINKFATELSKLPMESLTEGEQSNDNLVRDFATGNLVKEFDKTETDDKVIQNDQFNNFDNNLEELADDED
jgi:hypothetical protein